MRWDNCVCVAAWIPIAVKQLSSCDTCEAMPDVSAEYCLYTYLSINIYHSVSDGNQCSTAYTTRTHIRMQFVWRNAGIKIIFSVSISWSGNSTILYYLITIYSIGFDQKDDHHLRPRLILCPSICVCILHKHRLPSINYYYYYSYLYILQIQIQTNRYRIGIQ